MQGSKYWFKNKRYGYGWRPATREGWFVLFIYFLSLLLLSFHYSATLEAGDVTVYVGSIFFMTLILIAICYKTGEPLKWRWGE